MFPSDSQRLRDAVGGRTQFVVTACCQAPVIVVEARFDSLTLLLRCLQCLRTVGTPGLEDLLDAIE